MGGKFTFVRSPPSGHARAPYAPGGDGSGEGPSALRKPENRVRPLLYSGYVPSRSSTTDLKPPPGTVVVYSAPSPPSRTAAFRFFASAAHSRAFDETLSRLLPSPFSSSHLAHRWNHTFARRGLRPVTRAPRSSTSRTGPASASPPLPLAFSVARRAVSRSSRWFHRSNLLGHASNNPSKMLRPVSGEPLGERNSMAAHLEIIEGAAALPTDCMARAMIARPWSGDCRV